MHSLKGRAGAGKLQKGLGHSEQRRCRWEGKGVHDDHGAGNRGWAGALVRLLELSTPQARGLLTKMESERAVLSCGSVCTCECDATACPPA